MILTILFQEMTTQLDQLILCEPITDSIKSGMNSYSLNSGDPGNSETCLKIKLN